MVIMALILINLSACSKNDELTVYDTSVDVPLQGWTSADTLFYSITVTETTTIKNPVAKGHDYHMNLSLRYSSSLPLTHLPFLLTLQQTDTTGGYIHPIRNIMKQEFSLPVRDTAGIPLGDNWGSLYTISTPISSPTIRFDTAGTYRFMIIPNLGDQKSLPGVASIGIFLHAKRL